MFWVFVYQVAVDILVKANQICTITTEFLSRPLANFNHCQ